MHLSAAFQVLYAMLCNTVCLHENIQTNCRFNTRFITRVNCLVKLNAMSRVAKFQIGQVVRHRVYPFRGIIFDVDPTFSNTEQWYEAIPIEIRPHKDQPFYHLYAENEQTVYEAYVSEQNLLEDLSDVALRHPAIEHSFVRAESGEYVPLNLQTH